VEEHPYAEAVTLYNPESVYAREENDTEARLEENPPGPVH
jgi:hypothetical protein